jgi:hypothetical protein
MLPCAALSRRALGLVRLPLRNLHSRAPHVPFSLSHWSEPAGNGLVPIVVEQTVCGVVCLPCTCYPAGLIPDL